MCMILCLPSHTLSHTHPHPGHAPRPRPHPYHAHPGQAAPPAPCHLCPVLPWPSPPPLPHPRAHARTQDSSAAAKTVPAMLPTEVCAFQMPMMSPRLPLPDQLATMDTTLGQPVDWNRPATTCAPEMQSLDSSTQSMGVGYPPVAAISCPRAGLSRLRATPPLLYPRPPGRAQPASDHAQPHSDRTSSPERAHQHPCGRAQPASDHSVRPWYGLLVGRS